VLRGCLLAGCLALISCGGGNGGNGGGPAQTAQSCGGTLPDAQAMASWIPRQGPHWAYFLPPNWLAVEATNSIDISSPVGDAIATTGFAYGPLVPTTLAGVEDIVWMGFTSHQVLSQSQVFPGGPGQEQVVEFLGVWKTTGHEMHGIAVAGIGNQQIEVTLIQANVEVWAADQCTLTLVRNHTSYLG
jgi:hypothetical protein